jgi:hypothetical protein
VLSETRHYTSNVRGSLLLLRLFDAAHPSHVDLSAVKTRYTRGCMLNSPERSETEVVAANSAAADHISFNLYC